MRLGCAHHQAPTRGNICEPTMDVLSGAAHDTRENARTLTAGGRRATRDKLAETSRVSPRASKATRASEGLGARWDQVGALHLRALRIHHGPSLMSVLNCSRSTQARQGRVVECPDGW